MSLQASEEVEAIFCSIAPFRAAERSSSGAVLENEGKVMAEALQWAIDRTEAWKERIAKMRAKALEPDPDLQSYGPVMKDRILDLCRRYDELCQIMGNLRAEHAGTLQAAADAEREEREMLEREAKERVKREAKEEAEEYDREMAAKERARKDRDAFMAAAAKAEEEKRAVAHAKMQDAQKREQEAAQRPAMQEHADRFVACPIGERGEELTIEMALQLQERSDARIASFQAACQFIMTSNDRGAAMEAGRTIRAYLLNVLVDARSRDYRTIPTENKMFKEKVRNEHRDGTLA